MGSAQKPTPPYTGDFSLDSLILTAVDGTTWDLHFAMVEVSIYQSLFNNSTTCDVLITDAQNLINKIPLYGFETLNLQFTTPTKKSFKQIFRLHRITNCKLIRERNRGYILHFVAPECILNLTSRVSKSYKGKLISDMVTDLHTNFLKSTTPINVEQTQYQQHFVIPNIPPQQAINWLAVRANSTQWNGASYLYYQDSSQYNFVTMETALAQDSVKTYLFQIANIFDDHLKPDLPDNAVATIECSFQNFSDILENMQAGMYGNQLITHSQTRKLWKNYTFDYPSTFDDYSHLYPSVGTPPNQHFLYSHTKNDLASPNSKLKLCPTGYDEDNYPFQAELWLPIRISQLQQLQNIKLRMTIPGDSERTVGQVITLNIPSPEPPIKNEQVMDKYYQGDFLVVNLRHKIDVNKYVTTMDIAKDSTFQAYP